MCMYEADPSQKSNRIVTLKLKSVHKNETRFVNFNNGKSRKTTKTANYVEISKSVHLCKVVCYNVSTD